MFTKIVGKIKNYYFQWQLGRDLKKVGFDYIIQEFRSNTNSISQANDFFVSQSHALEYLNEGDLLRILAKFIKLNQTGSGITRDEKGLQDHIDYLKLIIARKADERRFKPIYWLTVAGVIISAISAVTEFYKD